MVERDKFGNYKIKYLGGVITIRPIDSEFEIKGEEGIETIPLKAGISVQDGSIKSKLTFDQFAALVNAAYTDPSLLAFLKEKGIDLKKGLLG